MNNIEIIKGVRCYVDKDNVAQLNLEDVARGLGFTQNKGGTEYVRWDRVQSYLESFEFSPLVGKDDFIPKPIFYLLAMKAEKEIARTFQHTIAYDILPTLRRHGTYSVSRSQQTHVYPPKATSAGEVAQLIKQLRITMKDNGQPSEIISQTVKAVCDQFGIVLPSNFVKVNPFQQFALIGMLWPGQSQGQLPGN